MFDFWHPIFFVLISHISGFLQEVLGPFISDTKHELRSLKFTVFVGCPILPENLGPEGVMESGSHISYTKTHEEQT